MTSPPEESSPSPSAAVQPSATLIEALHHKLCDPSIVPNFESCRASHVTQRLLTNRWVLQSNNNNAAQSSSEIDHDDGPTTSATQNNQDTKYNQVPKRNYLDIRIEQNTTFANEQCLRCQKKLAALSSSSSTTKRNSIDYVKNRKQIKKITDTIQSHLNEGLAACPNHDGLMKVDLELKCLVDRMNGVDNNIISSADAAALVDSTSAAVAVTALSSSAATIMPQTNRNDNMGTIDLPATTTNTQQISRAQAAINDALVEKMMFSQNDAVGANNNDDDDGNDVRWVPPTSNGDKDVRHGRRDSHSDDSYGKKRNEGHERRRKRHQSRSRSRSADRHEQDDEEDRGRKRKRKHGSHRRREERKKRKRRYRSRSPQSSSAESLSSRSISRERSKRKHRRDRHSHKKRRRHKSSRGKDKKKKSSAKRRHRSRRERSTSFSSSSSSSSSKSVDDTTIGRRFEPPTTLSQPLQQSLGEKTTATASKDDFGLRFEPPSDNKASSDEKLSGASRRQLAFIPPSRSDKTGSDESMKSKMQQRFVPKKSE